MVGTGAQWRFLVLGAALSLAVLAGFVGCGPSEPFSMAPATGKVTYEDGSLIEAERVIITFTSQTPPIDPKTHPRPATTYANIKDGTFPSPLQPSGAEGIVTGKHKVTIKAQGKDEAPSDAVGPEYADPKTTPIDADSSGSPFHFKVKKPAPKTP